MHRDFRVGSAYHIGTKQFPHHGNSTHTNGTVLTSDNEHTTDQYHTANTHLPDHTSSSTVISSSAFARHPLNLILAREQGDLGPSSKARRLGVKSSGWRVEGLPRIDGLQFSGNRARGAYYPDSQTFQESIQGSLWAVSRLHLENKFKCHRGCVNALSFNSNGNLIASGSDDLKVVVTNWTTGEQMVKYNTGHCMNIFHVKFLPESGDTRIVSCACDSEVRLAQLATDGSLVGGSTRLLVSHARSCHKLALPAGEPSIVMSAGADGQVFSIDTRLPRADCIYDRRQMGGTDPRAGYLHCLGADHLRATPGLRGRQSSIVLETTSDSDARTDSSDEDEGESDRVSQTEGEPNDGAEDGVGSGRSSSIRQSLSAQLGRRVRVLLGGLQDFRTHVDRTTTGSSGATGRGRGRTANRARQPRSVRRQDLSNRMESSAYSVTAAVYSNQGDAILASYNDEDIYLFNTRRPSDPYVHKYSGHRNMQTIVSATFFGPNSEYIVSGSDDGYFYIWDRESEGIVQWLHADAGGAVNVLESHQTLPVIASAGLDFDFKVWSPLHPLVDDDDEEEGHCQDHLKYTLCKLPPFVRRLRQSQLAKALHAKSDSHPPNRAAKHDTVGEELSEQTKSVLIGPSLPLTPAAQRDKSESEVGDTAEPMDVTKQPSSRRRRRRSSSTFSDSSSSTSTTVSTNSDGSPTRHNASVEPSQSLPSSDISSPQRRPRHRQSKHRKRTSSEQTTTTKTAVATTTTLIEPQTLPVVESRQANGHTIHAVELPQSVRLPFNRKDLELRVAQNWINRTCERTQMDGLNEANSRILSAIESVAQFHESVARMRAGRRHRRRTRDRDGNGTTPEELDSNEEDDSSGDEDDLTSDIVDSILLLRPDRCSDGTQQQQEQRRLERLNSDQVMNSASSSTLSSMPTASDDGDNALLTDSSISSDTAVGGAQSPESSASSTSSSDSSTSTASLSSSDYNLLTQLQQNLEPRGEKTSDLDQVD